MNPNSTSSILIIGGGKAGSSLAYYFLENKIRIVAIVEKDPQRIQFLEDHLHWDFIENQLALYQLDKAGVILLAVQDDKIGPIANKLAKFPEIWTNKTVLHRDNIPRNPEIALRCFLAK